MARFRVVLIGDEANLKQYRLPIFRAGYEGATARNGYDAMNILEFVQPDLIFFGNISVTDERKYMKQLRQMPEYHDTLAILVSARGEPEAVNDHCDRGDDLYLKMPIDASDLLEVIRLTIEERGLTSKKKNFSLSEIRHVT